MPQAGISGWDPTSVDRLNSRQVHHPVSPPAASSSTHMMTFASPLQGQALSVFQYLFRLRAHLSNELPVSIALLCSPPRFRAKGYYSRHKQRALFYSSPFKTGITCMQHLAVSRSHFTLRRSHSSLHQPLPFYLQTLQHSAPAACSPWQLLQLALSTPPPEVHHSGASCDPTPCRLSPFFQPPIRRPNHPQPGHHLLLLTLAF